MHAVGRLGYEFELLDDKSQLIRNSELHNKVWSASFVKLGSQSGRFSWGVGIHEDAGWASLQAVSSTTIHKG
jgi:hypothetical protein